MRERHSFYASDLRFDVRFDVQNGPAPFMLGCEMKGELGYEMFRAWQT